MTEVYSNIHRFPVVLPDSPLKELNCHIITGEGRSLLIDTGFCAEESRSALFSGLSELSQDVDNLDVFLTHFHADHAGLADVLKNENNSVFISAADSRGVTNELQEEFWAYVAKQSKLMGFPAGEELNYKDHPAYINRAKNPVDCVFLKEGDVIAYGGYEFTVLDLKGHTPGHLGLYEERRGLLFCGDHILDKITPNINCWDFETDYLGCYIKNLKKVKELKINKLFSAHRTQIDDPYKRIDGLLAHHDRRLELVRRILKEKPSNAYECSCLIKWDYLGGYFPNFPLSQKWFASSEMLAHLQNLYFEEKVCRDLDDNGFFVYSLK